MGMPADFATVFEPSEFADLWATIQERYEAGEPAIVRGKYTVVDNPHFGVKGGYQVEIVWIIALPSKLWRSQLPVETDSHLFDYLPNVVSTEPRSQFEMSALAQYSSWLFQLAAVDIQAMLGADPRNDVLV